ncbi:MAG: hypothetical protein ACLR78_03755 [Roseburia sp.]
MFSILPDDQKRISSHSSMSLNTAKHPESRYAHAMDNIQPAPPKPQ